MKAIFSTMLVASVLTWIPPAGAQDDAMEAQRCIWRCLANSKGADDPAYQACITNICDAAPEADAGTWTYGDHPVLGPSAHIQTGDGAIGLSCNYSGTDMSVVTIMSLKIENGLLADDSAVVMFDGTSTAQTVRRSSDAPYAEVQDNTCGVSLSDFRRARTVYLIDGSIEEISTEAGRTNIVIGQSGESKTVSSGDEAAAKLRGRSIPLKGSSKAIGRLLAQCPAARLDIENNCGI